MKANLSFKKLLEKSFKKLLEKSFKKLLEKLQSVFKKPSFLRGNFNFKSPMKKPLFSSSFSGSVQETFHKTLLFLKKQKTLLVILFLAMLVSDLLVMKSYEYLLPKKELSPIKTSRFSLQDSPKENYKILWEKNIFHRGSIPLQLVEKEEGFSQTPVKTALSFTLKGTIVHVNPARSVTTVEDQTRKTLSYKVGDIIGGQAVITQIERGRVVFSNQNNNRLEYIDLPTDDKIKIAYDKPKPSESVISENSVVQRNGGQFQINRSDINTHLGQIHEILQQARVVPHRVERDGVSVIEGYTFAKIDKGSIYEDLGFQVGDIIKSVNGEAIHNPQKALELFDKFKTSSDVKVLVERDGKEVEYKYGVNEDSPIVN